VAETRGAFGLLHIRTNKHTSTDGHAWGWLDTAPPGSSQRLLEENGLRIEWNGSKGLASAAFVANRLNSHDHLVAALEGLLSPDGHSVYGTREKIEAAWAALARARGQEQERK
jgi:hypothetical protein